MRFPRREFLKSTTLGIAAAALGSRRTAARAPWKADLEVRFSGLCAFVPGGGNDPFRVGLLNAESNPELKLHPHTPIFVALSRQVVDYGIRPENSDLPDHVAGWTGERPTNLRWWKLSGPVTVSAGDAGKPTEDLTKVGSIDLALEGRPYDYPECNPLDTNWPEKTLAGRKLITSVVTAHGGAMRNACAKLAAGERIEWAFEDNKKQQTSKQYLTDTVQYQRMKKAEVHVLEIGGKAIRLGPKDEEADVVCWFLNVPFDECVQLYKYKLDEKYRLWHFAAYYDLLKDPIPPDERPVPTTKVDHAQPCRRQTDDKQYVSRSSETVYCPSSLF